MGIATTGRLVVFTIVLLGTGPASAADWAIADGAPLLTRWAKEITPGRVLPEYPRPQLERSDWLNLNGLWSFALGADRPVSAEAYRQRILVPFSPESALSGIGLKDARMDVPRAYWYRRTCTIPPTWKDRRILLHFGAVSWLAEVFVNGQPVGTHTGGYDPFSIDITPALHPAGEQVIEVRAVDQVSCRSGGMIAKPVGKQRPHGSGIFYTASSGIWQTVWMEPVAVTRITGLVMTPDIDRRSFHLKIAANADTTATVRLMDTDGKPLGATRIMTNAAQDIPVPELHLWSPDTPYLYRLEIDLTRDGTVVDQVRSYIGMRKIAIGIGKDGRSQRILLNNQEIMQVGLLDQGYWPDGIHTAPSDEALRYDLEQTKAFGMNLVRKHIKVEPARFYYHCDRLGLLVWQDAPCLDGTWDDKQQTPAEKANLTDETLRMVRNLHNHPCIIMWVVFNEGWGQADTRRNVQAVLDADPSRLVNPASGWFDADIGHIRDNHAYPGPSYAPMPGRAAVCGECGGYGWGIAGHLWKGNANPYQAAKDATDLTDRMCHLLTNARNGWYGGMNALVYTQTTDVEEEVNGLMTYDRAIVKPAVARLRAAVEETLRLPAIADYTTGLITIRVVLGTDQAAKTTVLRIAGSYNGWAAPQTMTAKGGGVFEFLIGNPLLTGTVQYRLYPGAGAEWAGAEGPDSFHRSFAAKTPLVELREPVFGRN